MAFNVGALVAKLELNKKQWESSIKGVEKDVNSMSGFVIRNEKQFKKMGRAMTLAGGAIVAGLGLAVKSFSVFDKSMTESLAIMGDVSADLRKEMEKTALDMSTKSTFAANELAEGYFFLASAGLDAEQSIGALPAVTEFAQAGAFDLAKATDLLTDAQSALGLSVDNVADNQRNMIAVSDLLVGANTLANASVQQFAEALTNRAAAALRAMKKPMEEGVAVLAAFADQGRKGAEAGMALDIVLRDLQKAARDEEAAFERFGVTVFDANGKMVNTADIIEDLEGLLGDMSDKQQGATLTMLGFQERSISNIKTLLGTSGAIREYQAELVEMGGITKEVSEKQLKSFNAQMKILKNTAIRAGISIGQKLAPMVIKLVDKLKIVIEKITKWIEEHPKLVTWLAKTALKVGVLMTALGPLLIALPSIVKSLVLIKTTKIGGALAGQFKGLGTQVVGLKGLLGKLPAVGAAAFVGWKIGRLIGSIKGVDKGIQNLFTRLFKGKKFLQDDLVPSITKSNEAFGKLRNEFKVSAVEINKLKIKYGDYSAALEAVEGGLEEGIGLQKELTEAVDESGDSFENQTKKIAVNSDKVADLIKTLADEIKKATLGEFEFRKQKAEETFKQRKAMLEKEGANQRAFIFLEKAFSVELAGIEEDRTEKQKGEFEKRKGFWKELIEDENKFREARVNAEKKFVDMIDEITLDEFTLRKIRLEDSLIKELSILKERLGNTKEFQKDKAKLEKAFDIKFGKLRDDMVKKEKNRLQELKDAWMASFQKTIGLINSFLSQVGSLFQASFDLKMTLIDKEEEVRNEAINNQFNTQIEANEAIVDAEKEKSEEIFDSINADYEAKKQFILDNVTDEEERAELLKALEIKHQEDLNNARMEREKKEKETADALLKIEDEKNEAIRLASEELEKKRSEARKKAAKQEKAVALISAIVNTAAGVVKALASSIPPFNIILAAITAAAGAVQIALIKAQPLPMRKGGIVTRETEATLGEAGPEAVIPLDRIENIALNSPQVTRGRKERDININLNLRLDNININALDNSDMRETVRNRVVPEILDSLDAHLFKTKWQELLGIA